MWEQLLIGLKTGDRKSLAKSISFVENEQEGFEALLGALPHADARVIGVTGPPGAGKSTLVDGLVGEIIKEGKKVAVLCVDPSSAFHFGALLGDRIRMSQWYTHDSVFIRSLATRGSLGGLHPRIIEITELVGAGGYDYIIIETVGVGQSEVEIAGLADTTVVVVVPEAGDEVQTMKAGLMEIADIFVVNKSDRPGADTFVKNLRLMLAPASHANKQPVPVIKTIAQEQAGISELLDAIKSHMKDSEAAHEKKLWLLTEKVYSLVQKQRMKSLSKQDLRDDIKRSLKEKTYNLHRVAAKYFT